MILKHRVGIAACLLIAAVVGLGGARWRQAGPPQDAPVVAPVSMLMYWIDRSYGQMKLAAAQKKKERGEQYAWLLAELVHVNKGHSDNEKFGELSVAASKLSVAAAVAFKEGEFERAKELAMQIDQKCSACHDQFRDAESD